MNEYDKTTMLIAGQLMNGLIVRGVVKAGQELEYYNKWCIRKARQMMSDAIIELHK